MNYSVKITKGPFTLIDEYPREVEGWGAEEEHWGYNFTVNGHKGVIGEEHDGFRYLIPALSDSFIVENYTKYNMKKAIGKALTSYLENMEIKSDLSSNAIKTFNDLIDEL